MLPDCWIYVQERAVKTGRIQIFNNWSPYLVKDAENTVFLGLEYFCEEGDAMWNMSPEEWRNFGRKRTDTDGHSFFRCKGSSVPL